MGTTWPDASQCPEEASELRLDLVHYDNEKWFCKWLRKGLSVLLVKPKTPWGLNKEIAWAAVREEGLAIKFVAPSLQENKDVALVAVRQNKWALAFVSPKFQRDQQFLQEAFSCDPGAGYSGPLFTDGEFPGLRSPKEVFDILKGLDNFRLHDEQETQSARAAFASLFRDGNPIQFTNPRLLSGFKAIRAVVLPKEVFPRVLAAPPDSPTPELLEEAGEGVPVAAPRSGENLEFVDPELKKDSKIVVSQQFSLWFLSWEAKKSDINTQKELIFLTKAGYARDLIKLLTLSCWCIYQFFKWNGYICRIF